MARYKKSALDLCFYTSVALLVVFTFHVQTVLAELPPWAYKEMQKKAPEYLTIEVLWVKTKAVRDGKEAETAARVAEVKRSKSGLQTGTVIRIHYVHVTKVLAGPSRIPILEKGKRYPAFLAKADGKKSDKIYKPAAGGRSFEVVR